MPRQLGFGGVDPICTPAVIGALREHGVSACSSRLETGTTPVHKDLEATVARFLEKEAAVVVGMGFATNSAIIPVIVDPHGNGKVRPRPESIGSSAVMRRDWRAVLMRLQQQQMPSAALCSFPICP